MNRENEKEKLNSNGQNREKMQEQSLKKSRNKTMEARREISRKRLTAERERRKRQRRLRIGILAGFALLLTGLIIFLIVRAAQSKEPDSGEATTATTADTASIPEASTEQIAPEAEGPWRSINGKLCYTDASGNPVLNKIITDTDGKKYYLGEDGALLTSSNLLRDHRLYTADDKGVLSFASGWTDVKGSRYFAEEGEILRDRIVTDAGDLWNKGKIEAGTTLYYLDLSGKIAADCLVSYGGYLYKAAADGSLTQATGWQEQDGYSYYAEADGKLYISQNVTIDGNDYFMDQYGAVLHGTPTIDAYLGSRHLLDWMESHFNDYYFKTPYDGIWSHLEDPEALLRPYGEYGENGGMNCSGFISHLLMSTGGDLEKVNAMGLEGGFIDADSYLYLGLRDYVQCKTYDSVEELLESGEAKKGDILYLYPDKTENEDADCHLGVFWGDTPSENKFWSQAQDTGCGVTEIRMLNPIRKIYLFPIDER